MLPSEGMKMLVDGTRRWKYHTDGPIARATWVVSRAHLYGDARRCLEVTSKNGKQARLWGACMEREMQRQSGGTRRQKC